jgi:putative hydrolase of the HAD superfamily
MDEITLILDADDTLWENNIYYEEVRDAFADLMAEDEFDRDEAMDIVDEVEDERVPVVGYSPREFVCSIVVAYHRLCERWGRAPRPAVSAQVEAIARRILEHPIVLLDGVAKTLPELHRHFRLILLTKGDQDIQRGKVERSGLIGYFEAIEIVPEKGPDVLHALVDRYRLDSRQTWMVGNSPRSDINPALEAGIGAIYIPHPVPWIFEQTPIADPERVTKLKTFSELLSVLPKLEGSDG